MPWSTVNMNIGSNFSINRWNLILTFDVGAC